MAQYKTNQAGKANSKTKKTNEHNMMYHTILCTAFLLQKFEKIIAMITAANVVPLTQSSNFCYLLTVVKMSMLSFAVGLSNMA